ncbi:LD-carboxypeptidase [Elizabethkingia miricola]|uniref:LD-carboxypeptidase n=1 Tax=Elizabethkingia miricola TaxID=172045 RepID=A0ABD4DHK8_ELIMR|nr:MULTISPECIES: LD-carboxypeptidase [Elizabethkingia]KUY15790.1 LD-carboxypeptidase [Elizabethkingia miricola]MCL1652206.1 LD-carboxypeptidase [Elizabethkingia miricola]OPC69351.1 LD-carboxypeptidase [Elizabethkingia miricola]OPC71889.1 LD-carboxypeptidase [Elizabethkingia miricola]QCO46832.1 LD-carboxypeptidase [Elizabethkingia sp. 2-6]
MKEIVFPNKIKKGSTIAVITPAGAIEPGQLDKTLELIKSKGFEPVLGSNVYSKYSNGYSYGGTPEERLADLQWALDGDFGAIWTTRGGYGCAQLLQQIDLKKYRKNPKYLIGYSDVTVLQSYLLKNGFASVHGQSIKTSSQGVSEASYEGIFNILSGKKTQYIIENNSLNKKGKAKAQLVGGNLAMIYSVMGSKYSFDFKDKILFIEDIGEQFYALDRMLMNLELNGVFGKIKGLIVGGMTGMGDEKTNEHYESSFDPMAYKIITQKLDKYDFPVAYGLPNGHIFDNQPLIIGAEVEMNVKDKAQITFK